MKNSEHRWAHQRKKAIKEAEKAGYVTDPKQSNSEELHKHYHNPSDVTKERVCSKKKRSKRQNPGIETAYETEPEHIHPEGERWMQTVKKQAMEKGTRLRDKLSRRKV